MQYYTPALAKHAERFACVYQWHPQGDVLLSEGVHWLCDRLGCHGLLTTVAVLASPYLSPQSAILAQITNPSPTQDQCCLIDDKTHVLKVVITTPSRLRIETEDPLCFCLTQGHEAHQPLILLPQEFICSDV